MYNHDVQGTRNNTGEFTLSPSNVGGLHLLWSHPTPAPVTGTAAVVGNSLYVGDWSGSFYALDARTGNTNWQTQVTAPVSASALVLNNQVLFGDQAGYIYGLNRNTGANPVASEAQSACAGGRL
jgi:outer membrane protein assembly factor BamB